LTKIAGSSTPPKDWIRVSRGRLLDRLVGLESTTDRLSTFTDWMSTEKEIENFWAINLLEENLPWSAIRKTAQIIIDSPHMNIIGKR